MRAMRFVCRLRAHVAGDALSDALRLADVEDLAVLGDHAVDAGSNRRVLPVGADRRGPALDGRRRRVAAVEFERRQARLFVGLGERLEIFDVGGVGVLRRAGHARLIYSWLAVNERTLGTSGSSLAATGRRVESRIRMRGFGAPGASTNENPLFAAGQTGLDQDRLLHQATKAGGCEAGGELRRYCLDYFPVFTRVHSRVTIFWVA